MEEPRAEQMKRLAENQPTEGVPVPVEEFLKSIATLTEAERARTVKGRGIVGVKTSRFYALDDIPQDTFFNGPNLFGAFVQIQ